MNVSIPRQLLERRYTMRLSSSGKTLLIVIAIGVALSGVHAYPAATGAIAGGLTTRFESSSRPSPVTAAIAAAHHTLRNLFSSQAVTLDDLYSASLSSQGLKENDPGIAYGR